MACRKSVKTLQKPQDPGIMLISVTLNGVNLRGCLLGYELRRAFADPAREQRIEKEVFALVAVDNVSRVQRL
jgi:hypothetical protein